MYINNYYAYRINRCEGRSLVTEGIHDIRKGLENIRKSSSNISDDNVSLGKADILEGLIDIESGLRYIIDGLFRLSLIPNSKIDKQTGKGIDNIKSGSSDIRNGLKDMRNDNISEWIIGVNEKIHYIEEGINDITSVLR